AALEAGAAGAEEDPDAARAAVERARAAMMEARAAREGVEQGRRARGARAESLARDAASWESRLEAAGAQLEALERRVEDASSELEAAKLAPEEIAEAREALAEASTEAETRLAAAVDALTGAETEMKTAAKTQKAAEEMLAGAREERARLEARTEASQERAAELTVQLRDISGVEPEEFLEKLDLDPETLPIVKDLERAIVQLRQSREKLGAVNLRAAQELDEVSTERAKLAQEREDLEAAIAKLRQGVSALNREGRERLLAAYEEVNRNFTALFTHLFDGGDAKLVLVESDDPLEAGLEILCQPPGKRLASLSLLSGGEQTLTAISLIFAVFMVNPAPICVLDEVDAPLDDANVGRFCDLLDEMTRRTRTRFVIITHHAVSMSRMNRLFGVTMAEKGVSQLVSVDLGAAVDLVAA
ncbi:MAG: chromosome segregation protein SMC, partial [Pseudomonadota bacterium]